MPDSLDIDRFAVHVHPPLGDTVDAIGGCYELIEEHRLATEHGEILYNVGIAEIDNACCGVGGGRFAVVAGIVAEALGPDNEGRARTRVERITDGPMKRSLTATLERREAVVQVTFR